MQLKNYLLLFVVFAFELEAWSTVSEYWIIEKPSALVLYNQYEQRLTDTEKSLLLNMTERYITYKYPLKVSR
jgi:hypothetical protein